MSNLVPGCVDIFSPRVPSILSSRWGSEYERLKCVSSSPHCLKQLPGELVWVIKEGFPFSLSFLSAFPRSLNSVLLNVKSLSRVWLCSRSISGFPFCDAPFYAFVNCRSRAVTSLISTCRLISLLVLWWGSLCSCVPQMLLAVLVDNLVKGCKALQRACLECPSKDVTEIIVELLPCCFVRCCLPLARAADPSRLGSSAWPFVIVGLTSPTVLTALRGSPAPGFKSPLHGSLVSESSWIHQHDIIQA